MRILFIGINPHPGSYRRGVPFSNNKMFWYLLQRAGLIDEPRELLKQDDFLKKFYSTTFNKKYHFGLVNMVDRPSRTITELKRGEADFGRKRLMRIIHTYKPRIVCFVGKAPYRAFINAQACDYGWQQQIDASQLYVMHTPLHGPAHIRIEELQELQKIA